LRNVRTCWQCSRCGNHRRCDNAQQGKFISGPFMLCCRCLAQC
jgi:hypothetical protein